MQRNWRRIFLGFVLFIFLSTIGTLFVYWMRSQPLFGQTAVSRQPVVWSGLPTPTILEPKWTSYTNSDAVNDLLFVDGNLWIGTDGGLLVRSEQTGELVVFKSEHGLAGNRVTALALGLDRSIWVGTANGGVSNFNGRIWQTHTTADGLSSNQINDLTVTADGAVWVATSAGLDRYSGSRWVNYDPLNTVFALRTEIVRSVTAVPGTDQIYAATNRGLIYFDGRRWENIAFGASSLGSDNVYALEMSNDGALWIGHQAGLQRFQNGRWESWSTVDGLVDPSVRWITAVSSTEAWVGYGDAISGISHYQQQNGVDVFDQWDTAVHFNSAPVRTLRSSGSTNYVATADGLYQQSGTGWQPIALPSDLPSHEVTSLLGARSTMWASGDFGVGRFDGTAWQIFTEGDGLISRDVSQLALGPDQTPYATYGVAGMGLSQFRSNGRWQEIACPINAPHSTNIYDGIQDQEGGYWFSSSDGVSHFDQTSWHIYTQFHGLPEGRIWDIDQAPDGTIWVAAQNGFAYLEGTQWQIVPAESAQQVTVASDGTVWGVTSEEIVQIVGNTAVSISAVPSSQIGNIDASSDAFWLATIDGIARLDSQTQQWRTYTVGEGLPFNRTPIIWIDDQDHLWAVSESGPRDPANGYFIPYNFNLRYVSRLVDDRFQSTLITDQSQPLHGIITDLGVASDGSLWAGTLAGVSHFDGDRWRSYTMADGLLAPEVFALAVATDGVWVVTQNGVIQLAEHADGVVAQHRLGWDGEAFLRLGIEIAPDGTVWASNGRSLYQFDGQQWQELPIESSLGDARLDAFALDENGRLWGAMSLQGELLDGEQRLYMGVLENGAWQWQPMASQTLPQPNALTTMAFAPNGRLWGASTNGAWIFDTEQDDFGLAETSYRSPIVQITDIGFLPDGTTFLTARFENQLITIRDGARDFVPLPILDASGAHAVAVDDNNRVWVGTNQGINRLDGTTWQTYPRAAFQVEGTTTWLTVQNEQSFWLGTAQGQVISYNDGAVSQLPLFADERSDEATYTITAVFPQADNHITIGSVLGGVAQFDGEAWRRLGSSASLYDGVVQSVSFLGDTAWIGTTDGVVTRDVLNGESCEAVPGLLWDDTQLVLTAVDETVWFLGEQVVYWLEDGDIRRGGYQALPVGTAGLDGSVWFSTINGLMRHGNGRSRELITELPTSAQINTLAQSANSTLWMGAADGLYIYDQRTWQQWTSAGGLANNDVLHIAFAPDGAVWFATAGGVSRYVP